MKYERELLKTHVRISMGFNLIIDAIFWLLFNMVRIIINKPLVPYIAIAAFDVIERASYVVPDEFFEDGD